MQRRNTVAFIEADPIDLVLTPHTAEDTPSGGFRLTASEPRTAETLRLIPANDRMPEVRSSAGRVVRPEYTLMGVHSSPMSQWDTFTYRGVVYEVASPVRPVHTDSAYERKGDVVRKSA